MRPWKWGSPERRHNAQRASGALFALSAAISISIPQSARAIDQIVFEADEVTAPGTQAANVSIILDLGAGSAEPSGAATDQARVGERARSPTLHIRAPRVRLSQSIGELREMVADCSRLVVKEPLFACQSAHVLAQGGPTGSLDVRGFAAYDTQASLLKFAVESLSIAGGRARAEGSWAEKRWTLKADASALQANGLRALVNPWFALPAALTMAGALSAQIQASGYGQDARFESALRAERFDFSNDAGTLVAEKVTARLNIQGAWSPSRVAADIRLTSSAGQTLTGPVLLDFGVNPLELQAHGVLQGRTLQLGAVTVLQKNLLSARGNGRVTLSETPSVDYARVEIDSLELPAAYSSFAQLALAATGFGSLETSGRMSGALEIEADQPKRVEMRLTAVNLNDTRRNSFAMSNVSGEVHWTGDAKGSPAPSFLSWSRGSAYGLSGGPARLDFRIQALGLQLTRQVRLPILDGAVVVRTLALRRLGRPDAELDFDALIEPISMPQLSRAFGWPELQGELSGRLPGLAYRNRELTVDGDVSARVFDGSIVGRNFRLRDPLGRWPRLFADVTAHGLDLDLVTRTFPIGHITGRLDADIKGLELFNWSPVAFNARLFTTPGDLSRHLISQKALSSLSNVGGGGGGVTAALQSGVLRFFDDFRYDRIGITCQLSNDVCVMGGVEPARAGYYIVKGKGLPRIDIIGNQGRVDWPTLVAQIAAGMR